MIGALITLCALLIAVSFVAWQEAECRELAEQERDQARKDATDAQAIAADACAAADAAIQVAGEEITKRVKVEVELEVAQRARVRGGPAPLRVVVGDGA